jgi:hypothetical protein
VFCADDEETTRSAAGRAALEACAFAPGTVLPQHGVSWRAEDEEHVVAQWELPPERPEVRVRIDGEGAVRAVSAAGWNGSEHAYVPCGADLDAERPLGAFSVPTRMKVSWWCGTERATPFFRARIR